MTGIGAKRQPMFAIGCFRFCPLTAIAATAAQRRGRVETRQSLSASAATEGKKTRSVSTCAANLETGFA
jgi:hypothetical protein